MRTAVLPDPREVARKQAVAYGANPTYTFEAALEGSLRDCPFVDRDSLLEGLEDFHRERMARIPSVTKYPESVPWVEHALTVDREFQRRTGATDRQMAIHRSLGAFLTFRGFGMAKPCMVEKCRVLYVPDSDHGAVHIKNVDDPATHWTSVRGPIESMSLNGDLVDSGVGSGLHMDDEPEEIFPLPARSMMPQYADDVPGAVEFYTRYNNFMGGGNLVLRDKQKRSVAIEKCSYNFIEVFPAGPTGGSHCSGMVCRDPQSPQGKYQRAKREQYLKTFNQPTDSYDRAFWEACDRAEHMLKDEVERLGKKPRLDDLIRLFRTPWPDGLNKDGSKYHPKQTVVEYTLVTNVVLLDENRILRWQRDPKTLRMPEQAEAYQF